ncbi:hypothetical protein [Flexithrix dorotheae]|uniref:hypothetical protein n=1 Tax=Flexithrix dorotheae TaxID=70993 RepID=UPI000369E64E|nr:hypothetical protein [Flexithrix dorotheae]
MKYIILVSLFAITAISCSQKSEINEETEMANPLIGTWELISNTTIKGDSITEVDRQGKKMIKVFNNTHFAFFNHDLNKGVDSTALFVSGGGPYTLVGDQYTEYLEYCNFREWEGHQFDFTIVFKDDTLIQSGIEKIEELGVEQKIIEKYLKVMN